MEYRVIFLSKLLIKGVKSVTSDVLSGVPQGSVIGLNKH